MYPNFVSHVCDEGFVLRGSPKIKCQANGTWSKTSTFCEGREHIKVATHGVKTFCCRQPGLLLF